MQKFKAIIFDFNGVLLWDGPLQDRSWRQFSAQLRGVPFSDDELAVHMHGRNGAYTLAYLLGHPLERDRVDELEEEKEKIYRAMCLELGEDFRLSPGAEDLLDFLAGHGIPRTIATASAWPNVAFFIRHLNLARWFDVDKIVYNDGSRRGKPAPDFYLLAAQNLATPPWECVVVEDSLSGLQAAHAAGVGCVVALGPKERHPELVRLEGVDRVIEDLSQLPRNWFS